MPRQPGGLPNLVLADDTQHTICATELPHVGYMRWYFYLVCAVVVY